MKHSIRMLAVMLCAVFLAGSLSACGDTTPAESAGTGLKIVGQKLGPYRGARWTVLVDTSCLESLYH